jgi:hypothetical protein
VAERSMKWVLTGEDRSASKTLGSAAQAGEDASQKIGGAFQKLGSQIGGPFGAALDKIGTGIEQVGEHGISMGKKIAIGGAAVAGVGALLTAAGSKEKQATDQLRAAVDATGASYGDYADKIDKTVRREENFAHSAVDTKTALQTLTQATGDEQKALDSMQLVTDLAAAKHISLADAAALVARILAGKGGKTLAQYGITMKTNADGTKDVSDAVSQLGDKLKGQGAASMDNFGAKVQAAKTKLTDFVGEVGQKVGPALTVAGTVIGVVSGGLDILAAHEARAAAAQTAMAASAGAAATAEGELGAASAGAAVGVSALGTSLGTSLLAGAGRVVGPLAAIVATSEAMDFVSHKFGKHSFLADVFDPHLGDILKDQGKATKDVADDTTTLKAALDSLTTSQTLAGTQAVTLGGKIHDLGASTTSPTAQLGYLNGALDKLSNNAIGAEQQELNLMDAMAGIVTNAKASGHSLDKNTEAGRKNREGLLAIISGINDHAVSVGKQTGSVKKATDALNTDEGALRKNMTQAGYTKKQIDDLIHSYAATPKDVATKVRAETAAANRKIKDLQTQLDNLHDVSIGLNVYEKDYTPHVNTYKGTYSQHAAGGMLSEGWNTAGEGSATELMYKQGPNVRVLTHAQSAPKLGAGTTINHITINAGLGTDPHILQRAVIRALTDAAHSGQTIPIGKAIRP